MKKKNEKKEEERIGKIRKYIYKKAKKKIP